jgi:hypothetical protein
MRMCHIVTIVDGMVMDIETFSGDEFTVADVENSFLAEVAARTSNFDEYTEGDKEAICDNGYESFNTGTVQIFWAE